MRVMVLLFPDLLSDFSHFLKEKIKLGTASVLKESPVHRPRAGRQAETTLRE